MKRLFGVDVGLVILSLAFVISLSPLGTIVFFKLGDNIVDILVANPSQHSVYMQWTFFFLILPPLVGLIFCVIAYILEMKSPTGIFEAYWLPLTAFGVFFFLWGFYESRWAYAVYPNDIYKAINHYNSAQVATLVSDIYMAVLTSFFLWISVGVLLMISPILKIRQKTQLRR